MTMAVLMTTEVRTMVTTLTMLPLLLLLLLLVVVPVPLVEGCHHIDPASVSCQHAGTRSYNRGHTGSKNHCGSGIRNRSSRRYQLYHNSGSRSSYQQ